MPSNFIDEYTKAQQVLTTFFYAGNEETQQAMKSLKMDPKLFSYDYQKIIKKFNAGEDVFSLLAKLSFDETQNTANEIVDLTRKEQKARMVQAYKEVTIQAYNKGKITENEMIREMQKSVEKKRIELLTPADILNNTEGEMDFLVTDPNKEDGGLFPRVGVSGIVADPGNYKTFICLDLCFRVSQGKDWLQKYPTKQSNCLFIDEENGPIRLKKRIDALLTERDNTIPENLYFLPFSGIDLLDPAWIKALEETIIRKNIRFIVVDSFVDVFHGDENSVQDVQPVMHAIRTLATETESHFLLIHHTNKNDKNKQYRGSSAFNGALDLLLQLKRTNEPDPDATGKDRNNPEVKLYTAKARDVEHFQKHIELIFNPGNNLGITEKF